MFPGVHTVTCEQCVFDVRACRVPGTMLFDAPDETTFATRKKAEVGTSNSAHLVVLASLSWEVVFVLSHSRASGRVSSELCRPVMHSIRRNAGARGRASTCAFCPSYASPEDVLGALYLASRFCQHDGDIEHLHMGVRGVRHKCTAYYFSAPSAAGST